MQLALPPAAQASGSSHVDEVAQVLDGDADVVADAGDATAADDVATAGDATAADDGAADGDVEDAQDDVRVEVTYRVT
jgi:hypothetical protein